MRTQQHINRKTTFLVDRTWLGALQEMSVDQVAEWTMAVFDYANGAKEVEIQDQMVLILFNLFKACYKRQFHGK